MTSFEFWLTSGDFPIFDRLRRCRALYEISSDSGATVFVSECDPPLDVEEIYSTHKYEQSSENYVAVWSRFPHSNLEELLTSDKQSALKPNGYVEVGISLMPKTPDADREAPMAMPEAQLTGQAYPISKMPERYRLDWNLQDMEACKLKSSGSWSIMRNDKESVTVIYHGDTMRAGAAYEPQYFPIMAISASSQSQRVTLEFVRYANKVETTRSSCIELNRIYKTMTGHGQDRPQVDWRDVRHVVRLKTNLGEHPTTWYNDRAFNGVYQFIGGFGDFIMSWRAVEAMVEMTSFINEWCALHPVKP